jgi:hypothetical protein
LPNQRHKCLGGLSWERIGWQHRLAAEGGSIGRAAASVGRQHQSAADFWKSVPGSSRGREAETCFESDDFSDRIEECPPERKIKVLGMCVWLSNI